MPQAPSTQDWRRPASIGQLQMPQQGFLQQLQDDGAYGLLQGQVQQPEGHMTPMTSYGIQTAQIPTGVPQNLPDFAAYMDTTKQLTNTAVTSAAAAGEAGHYVTTSHMGFQQPMQQPPASDTDSGLQMRNTELLTMSTEAN